MEKQPIRIAQMMTDMNYGGVEMVVMNYYRNIDRTKVQFDFFALEGSSIPQKEEIEKLGGRVFIVPKYTHLSQYEKAIQKLFKENNYKIVHSHMNTLSFFSLYGAKKVGVPNRISHNHSTAGKGETKKNIVKYLLRPLAKIYPTDLCACSKHAGNWIYGKKANYRIFNNAIDLEKYKYNPVERRELRRELGLNGKKVIGHVGRFCYQKNHDFLIDILYEVLKKDENVVLMLIGEGELEKEVRNKVKKIGLENNVIFLGRRAEAYKYYQAMDVFVLPSRYEGLGMVAIEAQAAGIPTICSTEVPKEAKILDSTHFAKDLTDYVKYILESFDIKQRDTSNELRKAGYDIKTEARKLLNFYEEMLG